MVVSDDYINKIQSNFNSNLVRKLRFSDEEIYNSFQWDAVYDNGDFFKAGHNGQELYVSPSLDLVIAFFGTMTEDGERN